MTETLNLALDFKPGSESPATASVRIFVGSAVSFLKHSGAVVISRDCTSEQDLRAEVERLKRELSLLEEKARGLFAGKQGDVAVAAAQTSDLLEGAAPVQPKTLLQIDRQLRVADHMTHPVTTVGRNQMLDEAGAKLSAGMFRHLVVLDDEADEVVGILSRSQIALSALDWVMGHGVAAYEKMIASTPVKDVMQTEIITVAQDAPLARAAALLSQHKIGCLPVMEQGRLVGILTEGDFVSMLRDATVRGA